MGNEGKGRRFAPRAVLLSALLGMWGCSADSSSSTDIDLSKAEGEGEPGVWVHSGFYDRTYDLHLPPGMENTSPRPLLIVLHGAGGTGRGFRSLISADEKTDAAGFITVYPDGVAGTWAVGCGCTSAELAGVNDVQFLETLVHQLADAFPVDTSRVYIAGLSQGGQLAQRYACTSELPLAGMVSVAALLLEQVSSRCTPATTFDVLLIHGDADPVMRYNGFGLSAGALSVPDNIEFWRQTLACGETPEESQVADDNQDGTSVARFRFTGCMGGGVVQLDRVVGGGHTWPGPTGPWPKSLGKLSRNMDATAEILSFFGSAGLQ